MKKFTREAYSLIGCGTKRCPAVISGFQVAPQPNSWSCGPTSLRYCFMAWGKDVGVDVLCEATMGGTSGTSERQVELGCLRFGSRFKSFEFSVASMTRSAINAQLDAGRPLIVAVHKDKHWACIVHRSRRGYLVFDPAQRGPVITVMGWKKLKDYMEHATKKGKTFWFASVGRPKKAWP